MNLKAKWEKLLLYSLGIALFGIFSVRQAFSASLKTLIIGKESKLDENAIKNKEIKGMVPGEPKCRPCGTIEH